MRVYRIDYSRLQLRFPFKRFLFENIHCQLHHFIPFGGIDKGGIQYAVEHQFHSIPLTRQGIDAHKNHLLLPSSTTGSPKSPCSHTVIHSIYGIDLRKTLQKGVHLCLGRLLQPSCIFAGKQGHVRILADGTHKPLMALDSGSRTDKSAQFDYFSAPFQAMGYVIADGFAQLIIVGSDVCGIFIGKYSAVYHNHRYSFIESLLDNRSESHSFIGCYNQQVNLLPDEVSYVFYLTPAVVMRRTCLYFDSSVEQGFPLYLVIHLVTPGVVTAL